MAPRNLHQGRPPQSVSHFINYREPSIPRTSASTHRCRQRRLRPIYLLAAIKQANSTDGPKIKAALERPEDWLKA
jgi:hypothetical protein